LMERICKYELPLYYSLNDSIGDHRRWKCNNICISGVLLTLIERTEGIRRITAITHAYQGKKLEPGSGRYLARSDKVFLRVENYF
jgi:hypothetical protein